jgi:hypothetical protein
MFVAVIMQHKEHMRRIKLSSVVCLVAPCFVPHYLINSTSFGKKKVTVHKMCGLIFYTNLSEIFLILKITGRDIITLVDVNMSYLNNRHSR